MDNSLVKKKLNQNKLKLLNKLVKQIDPKNIIATKTHNDSIFAEISGGGNPQGFPMRRSK